MELKESKMKDVLQRNKENSGLMARLVLEVNGWDGSLESYQVEDFNDYFFEGYCSGMKPIDIAQRTFFGDIQSWSDEYIRFNGYGNFESLSEYQYEQEVLAGADEIIDRALEVAEEIGLDDILKEEELV